MTEKLDCSRVDFELLLEDQQDHFDYPATRLHVETCVDCQQTLETVAGSEQWWRDCWKLLSSVEVDGNSGLSGEPGPHAAAVSAVVAPEQLLSPPSHPEMLGRIGKYDVEKFLGRGGMGLVFKGFDTDLNRPVAVKVLAPHLADNGTARQRFAREARAAAAVVHEHVVAIHSVEATAEIPHLVMQYIPGNSLQTHVDRHGPLDVRDVVRVSLQIASGLAAAHAQGVIHRDIKPANIMFENGLGRVIITDFGLAQAADECSLTHTGLLAGTPHYMSPEQADAETLDHRSDLFSLGSVMYFMACGRVPFSGERALAVLNRICRDRPTPLRAVNPDVPAPLAAVIERLHEKQPERRFQDAAEVRDILAGYLAHLQQPLTVPLPPEIRSCRRRSVPRWLNRTIALSVAALAALALWWFVPRAAPVDDPNSTGAGASERNTPDVATQQAKRLESLTPLDVVDRELARVRIELQALEQPSAAGVPAVLESMSVWSREIEHVEQTLRELEETAMF